MLLLHHGQYFVVAQFHIAEADKDTVGHGTVPHLRVGQRPETDLVQIRFHVQQQTGPGHEIYLQNVALQRHDGGKIPRFKCVPPFPAFSKDKKSTVQTVYGGFNEKNINQRLGLLREQLRRLLFLGSGVSLNMKFRINLMDVLLDTALGEEQLFCNFPG